MLLNELDSYRFVTHKQLKDNQWQDDLGNPVFTVSDVSWNSGTAVLYPSLLTKLSDGTWLMAHSCYYGTGFATGLVASADDGQTWVEVDPGSNPIISYGSPGQWDDGYAGTPYFLEMGGRSFWIYYGARPDTPEVYYAIGAAYLGQYEGFEDGDVVLDRQIGWQECSLTNISITESSLYDNDLNQELVQDESEGVYLSSGSLVKFPINCTLFKLLDAILPPTFNSY